jgi:leader peptidase (prepilin peptidase)/N-methyltransferase
MLASLGWLAADGVFPWVALVLGLCIGSFLNVVIHRLPKMLEREWAEQCAELRAPESPPTAPAPETAGTKPYNLVVPRSQCPGCGHKIAALENVPVVSWLWLRGRCSACRTRISPRYPVVELFSGLVAGYAAWRFGFTLAGFGAMLLAWSLTALCMIDYDTQLLPDDITLPLLWLGLLFNLGATYASLPSAIVGAVAGYLVLWLVYWAFKLATGKEGMGYGDFKLLAALGAWFGWQTLPLVILASSVVGAVVGIGMMVFGGHARERPMPFGPYLAGAGLIALFWREPIMRQWISGFL